MINILLYEDNEQLRKSLHKLINLDDELKLLESFSNCNSIVEDIVRLNPQIILMDIDMPGINGIQGLDLVKKYCPHVKVVMHTVFEENEKIFEAIKKGASGYLLKNIAPDELLANLKTVEQGGATLTPSVAKKVMSYFTQLNTTPKNEYSLSEREQEVLNFLSKGHSYKMISAELEISIETVRTYIKRIYEKLQVHNSTEAVAKAYKEGLVR